MGVGIRLDGFLSFAVASTSGNAGSRQSHYEVYTEILGLSDEEFVDLVQQGVFE